MVLLHRTFHRSIKFHFALDQPTHENSDSDSASLRGFRSGVFDFASKSMLESGAAGSLSWLQNCFRLIRFTNRSFSDMTAAMDYPTDRWGTAAVEEYFSYTLAVLHLLNLITEAVLHLRHARVSASQTPHRIAIPPRSFSGGDLNRIIAGRNRESEEIQTADNKERVLLRALGISKEISVSSLGLVLSGLCGDKEIYLEIAKIQTEDDDGDGDDDSSSLQNLRKQLVLNLKEGSTEEVKQVNAAVEGRRDSKRELEILEKAIEGIEAEANNLFSETMAARNQLLDICRNQLK
ncbi:hypothetical protein M569_10257 [Genlisea aurea]|uniref:Uncharacterized protein n=1 Tax=Genlisea aurea TaxID=192259 RepID=S8DNF4_9LAMI|nr:hypothetical protein M569_10257 [Genlisea aurea]